MEGLYGKHAGFSPASIILMVLIALAVVGVTYFFLRKRVERRLLLIAIGLFLTGYAVALINVFQTPYMSGVDGAYYIFQVRNLVQTGVMSETAPPVVFYTLAAFSFFANDLTMGVKIGQALFPSLMILTTFMLVKYLTNNDYATIGITLVTTLVAAGIAGALGALKNSAAMAFAPFFFIFFLKFIKGEGRKWKIKLPFNILGRENLVITSMLLASVVLFLLFVTIHELTSGFVFMSVLCYVAFYIGLRRRIPWREFKFIGLVGILMGLALLSDTVRNHIVLN